jgi:putative SOS response-associated peptidase YedK
VGALGQADEPIESCTIITTDANELVSELHDRMPVILPPDAYDTWLHLDTKAEVLTGLLKPYPSDELLHHAVSKVVNIPRNDVAECVEPVHDG